MQCNNQKKKKPQKWQGIWKDINYIQIANKNMKSVELH